MNKVPKYSQQEIEALKILINPKLTDDEVRAVASFSWSRGFDPFSGFVQAISYGGRLSIDFGIAGVRAKAQESGDWLGEDAPLYSHPPVEDTYHWIKEWASKEKPHAVKVVVHKDLGKRIWDIEIVMTWDEAYPSNVGFVAKERPTMMLAKCAYMAAYRIGWPSKFGGVYESVENVPALEEHHDELKAQENEDKKAAERERHNNLRDKQEVPAGSQSQVPTEAPRMTVEGKAQKDIVNEFWTLVRSLKVKQMEVPGILGITSKDITSIFQNSTTVNNALQTIWEHQQTAPKKGATAPEKGAEETAQSDAFKQVVDDVIAAIGDIECLVGEDMSTYKKEILKLVCGKGTNNDKIKALSGIYTIERPQDKMPDSLKNWKEE